MNETAILLLRLSVMERIADKRRATAARFVREARAQRNALLDVLGGIGEGGEIKDAAPGANGNGKAAQKGKARTRNLQRQRADGKRFRAELDALSRQLAEKLTAWLAEDER